MALNFTSLETALAFRWAAAPILSQLAVSGICALLAAGVGALFASLHQKQLAAKAAAPSQKGRWPIGVASFAALLGVVLSLLDVRSLDHEIIRLLALAAVAWAVATLIFRAVGRTSLGWSLVALTVTIAALEALHLVTPLSNALDVQAAELGGVRISMWFAIRAVFVVGGLFWLAQRIGHLLEQGLAGEQVFSRSGHVLFAKLARAALLTAALLLSLAFLGVDITALAVLSGAVGLGLGFGFQKIVSNYVSGLILLVDKSIKPGDVIEIELANGRVRGEVTELAGRYTAITLRTGTETLIPNEVLIASPVINWSHTTREVQIRIPVGVAYSTDVEKAIALCVEAARATPRVLRAPDPVCFIVGFGDSSVNLEVRFWLADAENGIRNVSSGVYLEMWKRFQAHGVEIPFPQRDLHIRSSVPISVHAPSGPTGQA